MQGDLCMLRALYSGNGTCMHASAQPFVHVDMSLEPLGNAKCGAPEVALKYVKRLAFGLRISQLILPWIYEKPLNL